MKLVVNALLGVNMQAIAEAVAFGEKAGLNRELLLEVLAKTAVCRLHTKTSYFVPRAMTIHLSSH